MIQKPINAIVALLELCMTQSKRFAHSDNAPPARSTMKKTDDAKAALQGPCMRHQPSPAKLSALKTHSTTKRPKTATSAPPAPPSTRTRMSVRSCAPRVLSSTKPFRSALEFVPRRPTMTSPHISADGAQLGRHITNKSSNAKEFARTGLFTILHAKFV